MGKHARVFKGDIVYSRDSNTLESLKDGYIVLFGNLVKGVYSEIPEEYKSARIMDYTGMLIFPGLNNHLIRLKNYEELSYQKVEELWKEGTTRLNTVSQGSIEESYSLMDFIENMGLGGYFTHSRDDEKFSIYDLEEFSLMSSNTRILVRPYIFTEKDDVSFEKKVDISKRYSLKLSGVNLDRDCSEIEVSESSLSILKQGNKKYNSDLYSYSPYSFENLLSNDSETIDMLKKLLYEERLGLYTEEGHSIIEAIRFELSNRKNFSFEEMFYMATVCGGKFFGNVGKFEEGYSFDAVIVEDRNSSSSVEERLREFILDGSSNDVHLRYIYGMKALGK